VADDMEYYNQQENTEDKTELGVPNIKNIQARFNNNNNNSNNQMMNLDGEQ
jgi:hypothetical protein